MKIGFKVKHITGGPEMIIVNDNSKSKDLAGNPLHFKWITRWWDSVSNVFKSESFSEFELIDIL